MVVQGAVILGRNNPSSASDRENQEKNFYARLVRDFPRNWTVSPWSEVCSITIHCCLEV